MFFSCFKFFFFLYSVQLFLVLWLSRGGAVGRSSGGPYHTCELSNEGSQRHLKTFIVAVHCTHINTSHTYTLLSTTR